MRFGNHFQKELAAAGLTGLPIAWSGDGQVTGLGRLTTEQQISLQNVIDAHDPNALDVDALVCSIKEEAQRRINALFGETELSASLVKQMNRQKRATALIYKQISGQELKPDELAEMISLNALGETIDAIRSRSNALELTLPPDFIDDKHWTL